MTDITLTPAPDLKVLYAEANTERGEEFLDAYTAPELVAVDVGRIIVPATGQAELVRQAAEQGCSTELVPIT